MKKIEGKSKIIYPHSVKIYKDDIEAIIDILSEGSERVVISDDDYVYDSLGELEEKRGVKPRKIHLKSHSPYVSVELESHSVRIYCGESDKDSVYAFKAIADVLRSRKALISKVFSPTVGVMGFILLVISNILPIEKVINIFPFLQSRSSYIILMALPIISFSARMGFFSSIYLRKYHEKTNFFIRQKDDLLIRS